MAMNDPQSEFVERYAERGPKGDKGDRGEQGRRLAAGQARALVYLFGLNLLLLGAGFFALIHYVQADNADRCITIEQIVSIPVPHSVKGNPSREWESKFEAIERVRAGQLGCRP